MAVTEAITSQAVTYDHRHVGFHLGGIPLTTGARERSTRSAAI
jgi:hypothetical protein